MKKKPALTGNRRYKQGVFKPKNPEKYEGDATNILYRSSLELRYLKFFDENPNIICYASEELGIKYVSPMDGKVHTYYPDLIFKVRTKDGNIETYIAEIKPKSQTVPPKKTNQKPSRRFLNEVATYSVNKAKWDQADAFCKKNNAKFVVLTEQEIKMR